MNFDTLRTALIGEWRGTKQLYLEPPPAAAVSSPTKLSVVPVAGANFLRFDYDWAFEGETQEGMLLLGVDEENTASAAWIDSFHMSSKIMSCSGTASAEAVELRGNYAAPPGPDWSWRITVRSASADAFAIVMHNISPEGQEDLAVQIDYARES